MDNTKQLEYMQNERGYLVPLAKVREQDKLRDSIVNELAAQAIKINEQLVQFKKRALNDIADLIQIAADKYEVSLGGKKGNITLLSYNGAYKVQRVYAEHIVFTEEIEAAKELITQCIDRWSANADDNIRALVNRAFRTNRNGQIKTAEILGLLRLEIEDSKWRVAMDALRDSIAVSGSTVYVRVYKRVGQSDEYQIINLNLTSV